MLAYFLPQSSNGGELKRPRPSSFVFFTYRPHPRLSRELQTLVNDAHMAILELNELSHKFLERHNDRRLPAYYMAEEADNHVDVPWVSRGIG